MTPEDIKKFSELFKSITYLRAELNRFGYDFIDLTIEKGTNIDTDTKFPDKLCGLTITNLLDNK